jgi:hypothetical protein
MNTSDQFSQIVQKYYNSEFPIIFWYRGVRIHFKSGKIILAGIILGNMDQAIDSIDMTQKYLAENPEVPTYKWEHA